MFLLLANIALAVGSGGGGGSSESAPTTTTTTTSTTSTSTTASTPSTTATIPQRAFLCSDLPSIIDRVKCRLSLSPEERENELRVVYLPEECRALEGAQRSKCIALYDSLQKCWAFEGEARIDCVKDEIKLGDVAEEKESCGTDASCLAILSEKVYTLIKFRFYNLEEHAEEMLGTVDIDVVSDFVAGIELKKQEFK
mgnify:FL=1